MKRRKLKWVAILSGIVFTLLALLETPLHPKWEAALSNLFFQIRGGGETSDKIVIIGINSESMSFDDDEIDAYPQLDLLTDWPWPREVHAALLDRLIEAGAKTVVFDILFLNPSLYGERDDAILRDALRRHRDQVVVGSGFERLDRRATRAQLVMPSESVVPWESRMELTGFVTYPKDEDDRIRRAHYQTTDSLSGGLSDRPLEGEDRLYSIDAMAARKFDRGIQIPDWNTQPLINYAGPEGTFPHHPVFHVFHERFWEQNLKGGEVFRDKIVLIGATAGFMQDTHLTPYDRMSGVEVHANAINMLLTGNYLREISYFQKRFITAAASLLLATGILLWGGPYLVKFILIIGSAVAWLLLSAQLFKHGDIVLAAPHPFIALLGAGLTGLAIQFTIEQLEKRQLRRTFSTFVSPDVAEYLIENPSDYEKVAVGKRRYCVVLFSDIRGFTTFSERAETPEALVAQLNEYLSAWVSCVFDHHGTLDKFVGDAVMAVWGGIHSRGKKEDALSAVKATLAMREKLAELNTHWKDSGKPEFKIGVGINAGEAIVGNMGSPGQKLEFTVIGDAVNVAARLEGQTKEFGRDLLISHEVYSLIRDEIEAESLGESAVRGRSQAVEVFTVLGLKQAPASGEEFDSPADIAIKTPGKHH